MKILFVALDYHDYTQKIIAEMQSLGGEVTYVDILPRSTFYKVFRTLTPARYASFLRRHHARALKQAAQQRFDRVVFLQAHQVDLPLLGELRASQPGVPFVLYNWDSLSTHDYRPQAAFFNHVFTFDGDDAEGICLRGVSVERETTVKKMILWTVLVGCCGIPLVTYARFTGLAGPSIPHQRRV